MQVNAMTEKFEHIELFGKPVLFTNARVNKDTVPKGWYRYNIRGSDRNPGSFGTLECEVGVNHAGTIISPEEIPFPKGKDYRPIRGNQNFLGEDMTLAEFCECHDLPIPESPQRDKTHGATDLKITDFLGKPVTLRPRLELYSVTDFMGTEMPGLAVALDEVGDSPDDLEPYAVLTVSFGEHIAIKNSAYIDTNNCTFAEQLLEKGIAEPTGLYKTSGFCRYPLWIFKEEFLRAIGSENYQVYAQAFDQEMKMWPQEEGEEPSSMTLGGM